MFVRCMLCDTRAPLLTGLCAEHADWTPPRMEVRRGTCARCGITVTYCRTLCVPCAEYRREHLCRYTGNCIEPRAPGKRLCFAHLVAARRRNKRYTNARGGWRFARDMGGGVDRLFQQLYAEDAL